MRALLLSTLLGAALLAACGARGGLGDFSTSAGGAGGREGPASVSASSATASVTSSSSTSTASVSSSSATSASSASSSASSASSSSGACVPSPEVCDGVDNDCDGVVDPPGSIGCTTYYKDGDHDGYGVTIDAECLCKPSGAYTSTKPGDCDDTNASVHPGAVEVCNGVDDDCNGVIDDGAVCLGCPTASLGGHLYLFCQDHRSWPDALAACQSAGMSLLSINDPAEEAWVYTTEDGLSTEKAWMGLTDQAVEGTFVWANGDPVAYTDWESGEPNGGTSENCGQINRYNPDHGWNDEPCDEALHFICESQ